MKMIDKDAVVAEIERLREELQDKVETSDFIAGEVFIMNYFLTFIDSLQKEPQVKKLAGNQHVDKTCKENGNPLTQEPVSNPIDFEQELYKAFGQIKDFTLGVAIAKRFYDMGRKHNEPVSEDLEEAAKQFATDTETEKVDVVKQSAFFWGAIYHKQQMMAKAVNVTVHIDNGNYPYIPQIELYDYDKDIPLAKEGDKYKVVLIKEN